MERKKIRKENFRALGVIIAAVIIAIDVERPALSIPILIAGFGIALWIWRSAYIDRSGSEANASAGKTAADASKEEPLERLRSETGKADELTMQLRSILDIGDRLIHYEAWNSPVVAEILEAYSGFVRDYLKGAADFSKKYRRAKEFIKIRDPNYLAMEVRTLEKRIADGEKGLDKTLSEKKSTLHRLEGMVGNQPIIRNGIGTIQATLESLDASIAEAEADPGRQKEIMDQIQLTLSSTATAIEKTLVAASSSDQAIKQG